MQHSNTIVYVNSIIHSNVFTVELALFTCTFFCSFCGISASLKRAQRIAKRALASSNVDTSESSDDDSFPAAKRPRNKSSLEEFPDYSDTDIDSKFVNHNVMLTNDFFKNHMNYCVLCL